MKVQGKKKNFISLMQYFCCGEKKDAAKYFESDSTIITGVRSANTSVLLFRVLMPIYWESHALKFTLHAFSHFSGGKCHRSLWIASNRMDDTGIYLLLNLIL